MKELPSSVGSYCPIIGGHVVAKNFEEYLSRGSIYDSEPQQNLPHARRVPDFQYHR